MISNRIAYGKAVHDEAVLNKNIVVLLPDGGDRYLSTALYE